jgi:hypothetical protein
MDYDLPFGFPWWDSDRNSESTVVIEYCCILDHEGLERVGSLGVCRVAWLLDEMKIQNRYSNKCHGVTLQPCALPTA